MIQDRQPNIEMANLSLRYAERDDVAFIAGTQRLEAVGRFVSATSAEAITAGITDPDQAFLIGVSEAGETVAFAQLCTVKNPHRSIELRQLAAAVPGKGYGARLLQLVIAEAFERLGANRLWLDVFPDNAVARRLYGRLGFIEEGTLRDVYLWNGTFRSAVVMSILASDYEASSR